MAQQTIILHEDWQTVPFLAFVNLHLRKNGHFPAPPADQTQGAVKALVNQGRWIVNCPTPECGGAMVVSRETALFMCPYCANENNGGQWYEVAFPAQKAEIETILLKRPTRDPFRAAHRNWVPGESVAKLRAENKQMGIV